MSIDTLMYREVVVHVYNGILLSHKKEHMWVSSHEVDEPRACYTEWSKLEREKQISYVNTYIRNLENRYWRTYLQGRGRDADVENRSVNTQGRGAAGRTEGVALTRTPPCVSGQLVGSRCAARELNRCCATATGVGGRLRRERTYGYLQLIHFIGWQKPTTL